MDRIIDEFLLNPWMLLIVFAPITALMARKQVERLCRQTNENAVFNAKQTDVLKQIAERVHSFALTMVILIWVISLPQWIADKRMEARIRALEQACTHAP